MSPLFTINPSLFLQKTKPLYPKGPFTNYVYKRRGVGGQKKSTFCKLLYHRKRKRRGVGGQKKTNLVNVDCERPLIPNIYLGLGVEFEFGPQRIRDLAIVCP